MSVSRTFGKHVVVMLIATAAFCIAWGGRAELRADAAPYPPSQPCSVTATARGAAAVDGTDEYDVIGSGLGSVQPVRVILATTGQQVGSAQTDTAGSFRITVTAPRDADATAPDLTASSPKQTCTWMPPTPSTSPTQPAPSRSSGPTPVLPPSAGPGTSPGTNNGGAGTTGGQGAGQTGTGASGSGGSGNTGATEGSGGTGNAGGATTTPAPGSTPGGPTSGATTSPVPPLADPVPGSDTPFGIGLGIAAVLLVLGTLAVLLLTRRPER